MMRTHYRLACTMVLLILAALAPEPAYATGPVIKVSFQGQSGLNGFFIYDSSLTGSGGSFNFTGQGTKFIHETCYVFGVGSCIANLTTNCEPFVINLSNSNMFEVLATGPKTTALTIKLATTVGPQSALPTCQNAGFVAKPTGTASTFTMQPAGQGPSPVYVCQPRPACCLSRLFARRWCH
jgi:hypothetical protein